MKLPRWLVVSLSTVSVLAVLGASAWWWVTWPERTARTFFMLTQDGRFREAGTMCNQDWTSIATMNKNDEEFFRSLRIEMVQPRSWSDILAARQGFRVLTAVGKEHSVLSAEKASILNGNPSHSKGSIE